MAEVMLALRRSALTLARGRVWPHMLAPAFAALAFVHYGLEALRRSRRHIGIHRHLNSGG